MPGEFSPAGGNVALDAVTGRVTVTARTTYLALLTTIPTDITTMANMAEVFTPGSNGYSRVAVAWAAPSGDPSSTSNTAALTFGAFTGDPANIVGCALVDAATGTSGTLLALWQLTTARDPGVGDTLTFAIGGLTLGCD